MGNGDSSEGVLVEVRKTDDAEAGARVVEQLGDEAVGPVIGEDDDLWASNGEGVLELAALPEDERRTDSAVTSIGTHDPDALERERLLSQRERELDGLLAVADDEDASRGSEHVAGNSLKYHRCREDPRRHGEQRVLTKARLRDPEGERRDSGEPDSGSESGCGGD